MIRLTKAIIKNFRGLRDITLDPVPQDAFVTGENGEGKTTLGQAFSYALCGRCLNSNGKQIAVSRLIGPDAKTAGIELELLVDEADAMRLSVIIDEKGSSYQFTSIETGMPRFGGKKAREDFWALVGVPMAHGECALNPSAYLQTGEGLNELLASVILTDFNPLQTLNESDHGEKCRGTMKNLGLSETDPSSYGKKALGKAYYEKRRDVNREIKHWQAEVDKFEELEAPEGKNGLLTIENIPTIRSQIAIDRAEQTSLNREIGMVGAGGMRGVIQTKIDQYESTLNEKTGEMNALKKKAGVSQNITLEEQVKTERDKLKRYEQRVAELIDEIANSEAKGHELQSMWDKHDGEIKEIESRIAALDEGTCPCGGACPQCDGTISTKYRTKAVAGLNGEIQKHTEPVVQITNEQKTERGRYSNLKKELAKTTGELGTLLAAFEKLESAYKEHADQSIEAASKASLLELDIEKLKTNIDTERDHLEIADGAGDDAKLRSRLEVVEARMKRGDEIIDVLERLKTMGLAQDKLDEQEAELPELDWGVEQFYHGAFLTGFLEERRGEFESRCNLNLEPFGYGMRLEIDGSKVEVMLIGERATVPFSEASDGQRACMRLALATTFGHEGLVVADGLDTLDGKRRPKLMEVMKENAGKMGNVFYISATANPEPKLKKLAKALGPVELYWVEDGLVERVLPDGS